MRLSSSESEANSSASYWLTVSQPNSDCQMALTAITIAHRIQFSSNANQVSHKEMRLPAVCQDEVDMLHASCHLAPHTEQFTYDLHSAFLAN